MPHLQYDQLAGHGTMYEAILCSPNEGFYSNDLQHCCNSRVINSCLTEQKSFMLSLGNMIGKFRRLYSSMLMSRYRFRTSRCDLD